MTWQLKKLLCILNKYYIPLVCNRPLNRIPYRRQVLNAQTNNWPTNHVYGINRCTDIVQYRLRELYNLADVRCSERLC